METKLTPNEVAKLFCCSPRHVIDLIKSGKLAAFNIARGTRYKRYRVTREALEDFERAGASRPQEEERTPASRSTDGAYLREWRSKRTG